MAGLLLVRMLGISLLYSAFSSVNAEGGLYFYAKIPGFFRGQD
jgi:hypothetical protein